jgi:hypothetical protein
VLTTPTTQVTVETYFSGCYEEGGHYVAELTCEGTVILSASAEVEFYAASLLHERWEVMVFGLQRLGVVIPAVVLERVGLAFAIRG